MKWSYKKTVHGHFPYNTGKLKFTNDGIHFKGKNYNVLKVSHENDQTYYNCECIRHNGKRHFKMITVFVLWRGQVGFCESIFIERKQEND